MLRNTSCLTPQARVPSCHGRAWAVLRQPRVLVTCAAGQQGGQQPVDLPGGGVWLGPSGGSSFLFGADYKFAIKRDRLGGEGLIVRPASGPKPLHVKRPAVPPPRQLARRPARPDEGLSLVGLGVGGCVVIDTEYELMEQQAPPIQPNTTCTGIVPLSIVQEEQEAAPPPRHPRRTLQVQFTCNLCGTRNVKETNPHAWKSGSVFMRCDGCDVVHKMKDNLRIFHELRGPIFPPPHLRNSFLVQEVLDKIKARREREGLGGLDG